MIGMIKMQLVSFDKAKLTKDWSMLKYKSYEKVLEKVLEMELHLIDDK